MVHLEQTSGLSDMSVCSDPPVEDLQSRTPLIKAGGTVSLNICCSLGNDGHRTLTDRVFKPMRRRLAILSFSFWLKPSSFRMMIQCPSIRFSERLTCRQAISFLCSQLTTCLELGNRLNELRYLNTACVLCVLVVVS